MHDNAQDTWPPPPSTATDNREMYDEFLDKRFAEMPEPEHKSRLLLAASLRQEYGLHLVDCVNIVTDWGCRRGHAFPPLPSREKTMLTAGCLLVAMVCVVEGLYVFVHNYSPVTHAQRIAFHQLHLKFDLLQIGVILIMLIIAVVRLIDIQRRRKSAKQF